MRRRPQPTRPWLAHRERLAVAVDAVAAVCCAAARACHRCRRMLEAAPPRAASRCSRVRRQVSAAVDDAAIEAATRAVMPQVDRVAPRLPPAPRNSATARCAPSKIVAEQLRKLGLEVRTGIAHTGVVGVLQGRQTGPDDRVARRHGRVARHRAGRTCRSSRSRRPSTAARRSASCTRAATTGTPRSCSASRGSWRGMRDELPGTVVFVFQPAEEGAPDGERGGAELMLDEGLFATTKPEAMFGLHVLSTLNVGQVGYRSGPFDGGLRQVPHRGARAGRRTARGRGAASIRSSRPRRSSRRAADDRRRARSTSRSTRPSSPSARSRAASATTSSRTRSRWSARSARSTRRCAKQVIERIRRIATDTAAAAGADGRVRARPRPEPGRRQRARAHGARGRDARARRRRGQRRGDAVRDRSPRTSPTSGSAYRRSSTSWARRRRARIP